MKPKGQSGMDKDELNISIRKFLKKLGIKSQREMEEAITKAVESGDLEGNERLRVTAHVALEGTDVDFTITEEISLAK
tara:strand:- start:886 stop:1119 length:234 start_codon:yes stop_codon:yes gene_type:complete